MKFQPIDATLRVGDMVFAHDEIRNDGHIPELEADAILAPPGTRGVVIRVGHLESQPDIDIFLVQFETPTGELGPAVGCLADELRMLADSAG